MTVEALQAAYVNNCGYAEANDATMAKAFISACRALIGLRPAKAAHGRGASVEFDWRALERQIEQAKAWLVSVNTPDVIHPDFGNLRDLPPGQNWPAYPNPGWY